MKELALSPKGYQQITGLSTVKTPTVPAGASRCIIQAETQAIRWRDDGVDPTASVGQRIAAGDDFFYVGKVHALRFIEEAASSKINLSFYA